MKVFILEDISAELAKGVIRQLDTNKNQEPIEVVIFSQGGDVMAGNAIISALKNTGSHITTSVIGLAASMAAVISQVGDKRVIAEDASFNIHNSAMEPQGRPTKENHLEAANMLSAMDEIMITTLSNDTISKEDLETLMSEDILLTAKEAVALGFFDLISAPVKAVALLNKTIKMTNLQTIMSKINLSAIKLGLISAVLSDEEASRMAELEALEMRSEEEEAELAALRAKAAEEEEAAPPSEATGAELLTSEMVTRDEFDGFVAETSEMLGFIKDALESMPSTEETEAMVTTQTTAKMDNVLKAIKSKVTIPSAKQNFEQPAPTTGLDMNIINARVKRIKETSNQN